MASRSKKDLNTLLVSAYDKAAEEYEKLYPKASQPFLTCTHRPSAEQDALFKQPTDGIDNNGNGIIDDRSEKVTNAKGGSSPHNYNPSAAFDIAFINPLTQKLDWSPVNFRNFADIIKKQSPLVQCGIDFRSLPDAPHFELMDWRKYVH